MVLLELLNQFIHYFDNKKGNEFIEWLDEYYGFPICEVENINFRNDWQTWNDLLAQIVKVIGIDYRFLADEPIRHSDDEFLPFEKYYNWGRKHPVMACYDKMEYELDKQDVGVKKLVVPNNKLFRDLIIK